MTIDPEPSVLWLREFLKYGSFDYLHTAGYVVHNWMLLSNVGPQGSHPDLPLSHPPILVFTWRPLMQPSLSRYYSSYSAMLGQEH